MELGSQTKIVGFFSAAIGSPRRKRLATQLVVATLGVVAAALGLVRSLIDLFSRR